MKHWVTPVILLLVLGTASTLYAQTVTHLSPSIDVVDHPTTSGTTNTNEVSSEKSTQQATSVSPGVNPVIEKAIPPPDPMQEQGSPAQKAAGDVNITLPEQKKPNRKN
jgi:hypothetical protein